MNLEDKSFKLVVINHDGKNAALGESKDLGNHLRMAASKIQKLLIDDLVELNKGR